LGIRWAFCCVVQILFWEFGRRKIAAMALGDWQVLTVGSGTHEQRVFDAKLYLLIFDRTGSDGQTEGGRGEASAHIRPYH
jgi:hypothetical protein